MVELVRVRIGSSQKGVKVSLPHMGCRRGVFCSRESITLGNLGSIGEKSLNMRMRSHSFA